MRRSIKRLIVCLCTVCTLLFATGATIDGSLIWKDSPKNVIGVILPLSGKWESVGQKILKGMEMATNVFSDGPTSNVEYIIRDYGNDEDSIPQIMEELDRVYKAVAIIGPVGERAGDIASKEAQVRHLPSIMFTQAEMQPKEGAYFFRNFVTVEIQVKALLQTARNMGITRFAVMSPDDRFGKTFSDIFIRKAPSYGISIIRVVTYSPRNADFNQQVKALLANMKKIPSTQAQKSGKAADIEAILIPDSASSAAMIASYIYPKAPSIRLFGPMLWDTPDFIKVGDKYVENAVFLSGFFPGSLLSAVQNFNRSFTDTFKYTPSIWEASAFDTTSLLQDTLQAKELSRTELRDRIAATKTYHGVSGITSFSSNGALDKELYILTVKGGVVLEIHP
jgi:ABC-type branched-subunit amino acid transport system substrate-binding protein